MKTIRTYNSVIEAHTVRALLEGNGINAFVADENTVHLNSLFTNAIGGVRLQVAESDFTEAQEILGLKNEKGILQCPECFSDKVYLIPLSTITGIFLFVLGLLVPLKSRKATCMNCKSTFNLKEPTSSDTE